MTSCWLRAIALLLALTFVAASKKPVTRISPQAQKQLDSLQLAASQFRRTASGQLKVNLVNQASRPYRNLIVTFDLEDNHDVIFGSFKAQRKDLAPGDTWKVNIYSPVGFPVMTDVKADSE